MDQQVVRAVVEVGAYGNIVRAAMPIQAGDAIFHLSGDIFRTPTKYTIQLDGERHVLSDDSEWDLMNHGCDPNVRIDVQTREMIAARDIAPGEELNFNYNTTEWSMTSPFACGCGSPKCAGEIRGFRYLNAEQRRQIAHLISPYIAQRWSDEMKADKEGVASMDIGLLRPNIHVLAPYEIVDGRRVSPEYDPPAFREELGRWFGPLGLTWIWHETTLENVDEIVAAIKAHQAQHPVVVLNLCDGAESDGYPGLSVVKALGDAALPFTGASVEFYEATTSKVETKDLLFASGVATAPYAVIDDAGGLALDPRHYPVIVKPDVSAASMGIQADSVCQDAEEVRERVMRMRERPQYLNQKLFAESFIRGREFTILLIEDPSEPLGLWALEPCERVFDPRVPEQERFLIFERYWDLPEAGRPIPHGDKYYWYELAPPDLRKRLADVARRAMRGVGGAGYARVDMRMDEATGEIFVLEVNAQCGLSVEDSTTVGSMLRLSGRTIQDVMTRVLQHGLSRV